MKHHDCILLDFYEILAPDLLSFNVKVKTNYFAITICTYFELI